MCSAQCTQANCCCTCNQRQLVLQQEGPAHLMGCTSSSTFEAGTSSALAGRLGGTPTRIEWSCFVSEGAVVCSCTPEYRSWHARHK